MAELHIIGQMQGASGFPNGHGVFCKWKLKFGNNWSVVSGLIEGQTQIDSPDYESSSFWSHPIDIHLSTKGVQGWPQIQVEVFHRDQFGRCELYGYGAAFVPTLPGQHRVNILCWRPTGSIREEFIQFFLGGGPVLKDVDVMHNGTDRSWLQTQSMGQVFAELHLIHRNFQKYGIDFNSGGQSSANSSS